MTLPHPNFTGLVPQEKAWIVWIVDDEFKIKDLQVYHVDRTSNESIAGFPRWVATQVKERIRDIGNSVSDWNEWTLTDLLFKFGFQEDYNSPQLKMKVLDRLAQIQEFNESIENYKTFLKW